MSKWWMLGKWSIIYIVSISAANCFEVKGTLYCACMPVFGVEVELIDLSHESGGIGDQYETLTKNLTDFNGIFVIEFTDYNSRNDFKPALRIYHGCGSCKAPPHQTLAFVYNFFFPQYGVSKLFFNVGHIELYEKGFPDARSRTVDARVTVGILHPSNKQIR